MGKMFSLLFFSISYLLFNYTGFATLHGNSDAPLIVGILCIIGLFTSFIFNLKAMTITAVVGYIIGFFIGVYLETDGIVIGDELIHDLWLVWLVSLLVFIGLGLVFDSIKRIKDRKGNYKRLYPGLILGIFIVIVPIVAYITKPLTMNDVIHHKPNFSGKVIEINDKASILVEVKEDEGISKTSDNILVFLDLIMSDSSRNFHIGDEVVVYFEGIIEESEAAQIQEVYAIFRK